MNKKLILTITAKVSQLKETEKSSLIV